MSFPGILKKLGVQNGERGHRLIEPPMPIIVGVGRSGTTLLRLMLDAHPDLAIPPETHFLYRLSKLRSKDEKLKSEFLEIVLNTHEWADFHVPERAFRDAISEVVPFRVDEGVRLFYRLYAKRLNKTLWGDKTPGYVLRMEKIQRMLPEARFIHIIRDGRDVAASRLGLFFGPGEDISAEANDWRNKITSARKQALQLPHYMEVKYEELVSDPENHLKRICDYLELPFTEAMLNYHQTAADRVGELTDMTNPDGSLKLSREKRVAIHQNTSAQPNSSRVGRWSTELSSENIERYHDIAGDLLLELGYEI